MPWGLSDAVWAPFVVGPVDHDRRLAGCDRRRVRVDRDEVARVGQLLEEVDAGGDVVGRPAVGQCGQDDAVEAGGRLERVAVEGDLALVLGIGEVGDLGDVAELRVVADRLEARVVVGPEAGGLLVRVGDVRPRRRPGTGRTSSVLAEATTRGRGRRCRAGGRCRRGPWRR